MENFFIVLQKYLKSSIIKMLCGYSLMAESHASDLVVRVRFPLPAPYVRYLRIAVNDEELIVNSE